jgi:hypothetical protein
MLWFPLSLLAAFSLATADSMTKKFFGNLSPYEMGTVRIIYTIPWLIGSFFLSPWSDPIRSIFCQWQQDCRLSCWPCIFT